MNQIDNVYLGNPSVKFTNGFCNSSGSKMALYFDWLGKNDIAKQDGLRVLVNELRWKESPRQSSIGSTSGNHHELQPAISEEGTECAEGSKQTSQSTLAVSSTWVVPRMRFDLKLLLREEFRLHSGYHEQHADGM